MQAEERKAPTTTSMATDNRQGNGENVLSHFRDAAKYPLTYAVGLILFSFVVCVLFFLLYCAFTVFAFFL